MHSEIAWRAWTATQISFSLDNKPLDQNKTATSYIRSRNANRYTACYRMVPHIAVEVQIHGAKKVLIDFVRYANVSLQSVKWNLPFGPGNGHLNSSTSFM